MTNRKIILKKVMIEKLQNDIRNLKEDIAEEENRTIKRTGYVIVSAQDPNTWNWRKFITSIESDGNDLDWTATDIQYYHDTWLYCAMVFKHKDLATYVCEEINKKWNTIEWYVMDINQCKDLDKEPDKLKEYRYDAK